MTTTTRKGRRKPGGPIRPLTMPFTIIQDTREVQGGMMWQFTGIVGNSNEKYRPLIVPTEIATLQTGDYSLKGFENRITIERKSASDIFGCFYSDRFESELTRMMDFEVKAVVIESDWSSMLTNPPNHSRASANSVFGAAVSSLACRRIPWIACPGRRFAELYTFQLLRKFWEDQQSQLEKEI